MYAVIKTGGKQYKVEEGDTLLVEKLGQDDGDVELTPVLLVDGETIVSSPDALAKATVSAKVLGAGRGPKITGFTYKNKSNQRKRWGHRQHYSNIEITGIKKG
ncbi:MAG: 50S ribosomal protein L21 [Acidimicrobiales bacterium]|jgi:large subunit ribosomal protein L21|nr:50S ribosomal protein L21 [Acidimicrobiales bacterium]